MPWALAEGPGGSEHEEEWDAAHSLPRRRWDTERYQNRSRPRLAERYLGVLMTVSRCGSGVAQFRGVLPDITIPSSVTLLSKK